MLYITLGILLFILAIMLVGASITLLTISWCKPIRNYVKEVIIECEEEEKEYEQL